MNNLPPLQNQPQSFLKNHLLILLLLIIFVALKIPHLNYPFYWDECWPYATAVQRLYLHGPSMMPNAIDAEYSRGHPMLFHFLAACWMKVFGNSHIAMHAFPLTIATALLATVYAAGCKMFNKSVGLLAALLLAFQVSFFVQASYLLLEIFIALTGFLTIYFYSRKQYVLTTLTLTALFYTKESGVMVGVLLGLDALWQLLSKTQTNKEKLKNLLSVSIPFVAIALFFVLQKALLGWYIFPYHSELIDKTPDMFIKKMEGCIDVLFNNNYRAYLFSLLVLLSIIAAAIKRNIKYAALVMPALMAIGLFYFTFDRQNPTIIFIGLFHVSLIAAIYLLLKTTTWEAQQKKMLLLLALFIPLFFMFTSINMFISRYLMIALIPVLFIAAVLFHHFVTVIDKRLFYPVVIAVAAIMGFSFYKDKGIGDLQLGSFDAMRVQQGLVSFMEENNFYDKQIGTNAYLERAHLTDPYTGYLKSSKTFSKVHWEILPETEVALFNNIEPDYQYEMVKNSTSFKRIYRTEKGEAWGEVYIRVKK